MGYSVEVGRDRFRLPEGAMFVQAHMGLRAIKPSVVGYAEADLELTLSWPAFEERYGRKARFGHGLNICGTPQWPVSEDEREAVLGELVDIVNAAIAREATALRQRPTSD